MKSIEPILPRTKLNLIQKKKKKKKIELFDDNTISRPGIIKICKRLSDDLLDSKKTDGYNGKKVTKYKLSESENKYLNIARKLVLYPILFLNNDYGREGVQEYVIPNVQKELDIDLGDWLDDVDWILTHSPTAFYMTIDPTIVNGQVARFEDQADRLNGFLSTLASAIKTDLISFSRSQLLFTDPPYFKQEDQEYVRIRKKLDQISGEPQ